MSTVITALALGVTSPGAAPILAQSVYVQRVRVGSSSSFTDAAGHIWLADQPYSPGGFGYTQGAYVYSTTAGIASTPDGPLFQNNRHDTSVSYRFDVPDGTYQVRLRFAEIYPNSFGVGQRVFNVSIGGTVVLQNFDVFARAGADTALDESFTSTVTNSALTITFSAVVSMPEVNAIEVIATGSAAQTGTASPTPTATATATASATPTATPTATTTASPAATATATSTATPGATAAATPTPTNTAVPPAATGSATATPMPTATVVPATVTPTATATLIRPTPTASPTSTSTSAPGLAFAERIRAGSSTGYTDLQGAAWSADQSYAPGSFGYTSGYSYVSTSAISGTVDPALYQTNRHDTAFDYRFDVPNGTYAVRLRFAEIYPSDAGIGRRVMNVGIQGTVALQNFDVFATAGGANIAVDRTFNVLVSNGALDVAFSGVVSHAEVNAIEVVQVTTTPDFTFSASPATQTIGVSSTAQFSATVQLTGGLSPNGISLWVTGLPPGITGSFAPNPLPHEGTSDLFLSGDGTASPGVYSVTLGATAEGISHWQSVNLVVSGQPDFSLVASPLSQDVAAGGASVSYQLTVAPINNFTAQVTLSAAGLPGGASANFSPNPVAPGQVVAATITADTSATPGTYSVNLTATSGGLTHTTAVTLVLSSGAVWSVTSIGTTNSENNSMRVGPGRNDGVNRLYVGTVNTGRVIEFSWSGSGWSSGLDIGGSPTGVEIHNLGIGLGRNDGINRVYACSLDGNLYELSYSGGAWIQTTVGSPTGYCTHAAVGPGRSDGVNRLYATRGLYVFEYTWTGADWNAVEVGRIATGLAHGIAIAPGRGGSTNHLYVATTYSGTYEASFAQGSWSLDSMGDSGDVRNVSAGVGRNDGLMRVYAATQSGEIREFTWNGTSWTFAPLVAPFAFTLVHAYVAAARNDGLMRVYSSGADGSVYEFTYTGSAWTVQSLGGGTGYAYGFHLGEGRNDGRLRLYGASFDRLVYEYSFGS